MMNVQELIDELQKISDKSLPVVWPDRYGLGGDCCSTEEYHYHYDGDEELADVDDVHKSSRSVRILKNRKYTVVNESVIVIR
jgi:hypothetical protein